MFIDPEMGRRSRPTDDIPWGVVALVLAIATILILLIGCQMPLR
jgi:hypothetical protein